MVYRRQENREVIACAQMLREQKYLLDLLAKDSAQVIKVFSEIFSAQGITFTQEILAKAISYLQAEQDLNAASSQPILHETA